MENIVKKAIEGGYVKERYYFDENGNWDDEPYEVVVCNPLFWQALGKACGWKDWEMIDIRTNFFDEVFRIEGDDPMGWSSAVSYLEALITNQDK